ncbi:endoribonuclease dicer 2-like protein, partial [Trifolium pratense]
SSKKQPIVTLSTTEAEFIAAASSACQGIWLSRILAQIDSRKNSCITIYCDNSSSIKLSKNPVMHGRSKHIDVRFHFLRDLTKEGAVQLVHCSSFEQVADIMTKALSFESFSRNRDKLGLFNLETGSLACKEVVRPQYFAWKSLVFRWLRRLRSHYLPLILKLSHGGFIRNEPFDPKTWIIPGAKSRTGGETAALLFMDWIGIKVNFNITPYERQFNACPENIVNDVFLESLLKYSFRDRSLLVEALTCGSYMLPDVPRCYQRLEYLGDSVLDYLITMHLYKEYPGMSPGQLTDMRAASVNNDCYARSAIKVQLHKHIVTTLDKYNELSSASTFGWESEASFPKVLGDIIESLAGAILVDSGYNKEVVWQSIRPLLEPLVTPDTLTVHPIRELTELCQKMNYPMQKTLSRNDGVTNCRIDVIADGVIHQYEYKGSTDRKTATRLACKGVLNSLQLKETQDK